MQSWFFGEMYRQHYLLKLLGIILHGYVTNFIHTELTFFFFFCFFLNGLILFQSRDTLTWFQHPNCQQR